MTQWVWQQLQWPQFSYEPTLIAEQEKQFLQNAGFLLGAFQHVSSSDQEQLKIDLVSEEAIETSAIEGEFLDRASVQASLRQNFGLSTEGKRSAPAEQGIAYMMVDVYKNFAAPLTHDAMYEWHLQLMKIRLDLTSIGAYRQHTEPMQIVSGSGNKTRVHYEAPPSTIIQPQMERFIHWYNSSINLPIITRAALAHVYFEMLHPFEDGNGRIGRALVEKAIAQSLQQPLLLAISKTIQRTKKEYYAALATVNTNLNISDWLIYFAQTLLNSQDYTRRYIEFIIAKTKLYDRIKDQLNPRQEKVISRIFREGLDGFAGGLSAENYIAITQTSRATATRDLQDLVTKKVLFSSGERKSTRYYLHYQDL